MIPKLGEILTDENLSFLKAFAKSCRRTIIEMTMNAQSGHPGGSLSSIDYLTLLYTFIISKTGEKVVVSNGHISPAVYSVLAELGLIDKAEVINTFRKAGSIYEGHVSRHVLGVDYGTGPLGTGVSAAAGMALGEVLKESNKKVFAVIGDGESQEGQVYEMMNFAQKFGLKNFIVFLDYNAVQLSGSTTGIMPINLIELFKAGGWNVIETDGHNFQRMWSALDKAYLNEAWNPTLIVGHTIMGKGISFMEKEGVEEKATWHGSAPKPEQSEIALNELVVTEEEKTFIQELKKEIEWKPVLMDEDIEINTGQPIIYSKDELIDCRTAYGKALLNLAMLNKNLVALSADLKGSVMTKFVADELPEQHIECGIAEQNMVSVAGGLSLSGYVPFASSFGAFLSSRAKDQARVNDINECNVKMVATHSGLSVGEDGPTHQSIDDMGSFLGMFNTKIIEPSDPNQTDRIIRFIAKTKGQFYVRMGRHKLPVVVKENGDVFYDDKYVFQYGKSDQIRRGKDLTIIASGPMVCEALKAYDQLKEKYSIEIIAISSITEFDENLFEGIKKTKRIITIEDHNIKSGMGSQVGLEILKRNIQVETFLRMGVENYQFSGKVEELYKSAGINYESIIKKCEEILK